MKIFYLLSPQPSYKTWLHFLTQLKTTTNTFVVGFLYDCPLRAQLEGLQVECILFKGPANLFQYLQYNKFDVIHSNALGRLEQSLAQYAKGTKIFDTPLLLGLNPNLISKTNKDFVRMQNKFPMQGTIVAIPSPSLEAVKNICIPMASSLQDNRENVHLAIYEASEPEKILQLITQQKLNRYISVHATDEVCVAADVYLDVSSPSTRVDTLVALYKGIPVVLPNTKEHSELLAGWPRRGHLYDQPVDHQLLKRYCLTMSALKAPADLPPAYFSSSTVLRTLENYKSDSPLAVVSSPAAKPPKPEEAVPVNQAEKEVIYYIIPYGIHGGAEIYLKNYLKGSDPSQVCLLFLAIGTQLEKELRTTYKCIVVGNLTRLGNFLLGNQVKRVCFYNSKAVYLLLARIKTISKFHVTEIIHSYLSWGDSMHGIARIAVDRKLVVADIVAKQWNLTEYEITPPTIDKERFKPSPRIRAEGKIVVGTVARLSAEKNLTRVVDIASIMDETYEFVIIGQDGGTKDQLQGYINRKGLTNKVRIKSYNTNIEQEYANFDLFLLTSTIEGTPLTILEALACGLPVVAPNVGAITEMLQSSRTHVFELSDSNESIARGIRGLVSPTVAPSPLIIPPPALVASSILSPLELLRAPKKYDLVMLTDVEETLAFHSCENLQELFGLIGKKVLVINKQTDKHYHEKLAELRSTNKILLYRTRMFPADAQMHQSPTTSIGYLLDDNILSASAGPNSIELQSVLNRVDYCLANTETLTDALKIHNPKSFYMGTGTFWDDFFLKKDIPLPIRKNFRSNVRIGVTYGPSHISLLRKALNDLVEILKDIDVQVTIVYFAPAKVDIPTSSNVTLEHHKYAHGPVAWYRKLFKLELDLCYVEYIDSEIIRSKSNLKFREAAFMKIPLFATDPTATIYKQDIINEQTGYSGTTSQETLDALKKCIQDRSELQRLGENAYNSIARVPPQQVAQRIWNTIELAASRPPLASGPKVSVIMSTHARNRGDKYCDNQLKRSIDSILAQTFTDFELFIADDASTDGTSSLLARYESLDPRIRVIRFDESCRGFTAKRYNYLIRNARAPLIALMFDDDQWYPIHLKTLYRPFENDSELILSYGQGQPIDAESGRYMQVHGAPWSSQSYLHNPIPCCATLMRQSIFEKIGYSDESEDLRRCSDHEVWINMQYNKCKAVFIPVVIARGWVGNSDSIGATIGVDLNKVRNILSLRYPGIF